jgi:hypothetical protein
MGKKLDMQVIPNSDAYRENYDRIFRRDSSMEERPPCKRLAEGSSPSLGSMSDEDVYRFLHGMV